jgi:DNA-binding beta-propeller fold protein YncE
MQPQICGLTLLTAFCFGNFLVSARAAEKAAEKKLLYVAVPGIRDYLEYGGHGILVFDIENGHKFLKRIPAGGVATNGHVVNVKGICASAKTQRLYLTTTNTLACYDLQSDRMLWEKRYEGGCDRMAISPDGTFIYLPSFEGPHWHVVDASTGTVLKKIVTGSGAHNTIISQDGKFAYLAGLKSPVLRIADTSKHEVVREIGPFSDVVRPFTINSARTKCYVNVNNLLGFEVGDLPTGKKMYRVEISGYDKGPVKRHGCPSHGIGLTPDEQELWVTDATNKKVHVFDNTKMPPVQIASIKLRDEPGWISFSIDGKLAWPSTGVVIEVSAQKIIAALKDETGQDVQSEKLLEIDFAGGKAVRAGNQFGIGGANGK